MIKFLGNSYFDDRMFILEILPIIVKNFELTEEKEMWSVITRKNSPGYYPTRTDDFVTKDEAIEFYKKIILQTPLVSMKGKPLNTVPDYNTFVEKLKKQGIDITLY